MSATICGRCRLDMSSPNGKVTLARCKDIECPMKKRRFRVILPILLATALTGGVIGAAALGITWLSAKPDKTGNAEREKSAETMPSTRTSRPVASGSSGDLSFETAASPGASTAPPPSGSAPAPVMITGAGASASVSNTPSGLAMAATPPAPVPDPVPTPAASSRVSNFSCSGRISAGRALVCSDMGLAISDYNLSLLYKSVMTLSARPAAIQGAQLQWLRRIDAAGADKDLVSTLYRDRFNELSRLQASRR